MNNEMTNILVKAQITATSKKNTGDFSQEIPTKTAYVSVENEEEAQKLIDFGLTQYTSKPSKDNPTPTDYFIIKFPADLVIYEADGTLIKRPDLSQIIIDEKETNNFKTTDDKFLHMNIIKSNFKNNDFYRLQAILVDSLEDIEEIVPENPFEDLLPF